MDYYLWILANLVDNSDLGFWGDMFLYPLKSKSHKQFLTYSSVTNNYVCYNAILLITYISRDISINFCMGYIRTEKSQFVPIY